MAGSGRDYDRRVRTPSQDERSRSRRSRSHSRGSRRRSRSHRRRSRSPSRSRHHQKRSHPIEDDDKNVLEEDSDGSDHDRDEYGSRSKRLKMIDVSNPFSAFEVKTKTKLSHIQASDFCKEKWNTIRGMDIKSSSSSKMTGLDLMIGRKWPSRTGLSRSGDPAFSDTRLDSGVQHSLLED
jgi:hypothetical protein